MSNEDNKTHGGKGINTPTAADSNRYEREFAGIDWSKDAKGKPRITHNNSQAMPQADEFSGYIKCETVEGCD